MGNVTEVVWKAKEVFADDVVRLVATKQITFAAGCKALEDHGLSSRYLFEMITNYRTENNITA